MRFLDPSRWFALLPIGLIFLGPGASVPARAAGLAAEAGTGAVSDEFPSAGGYGGSAGGATVSISSSPQGGSPAPLERRDLVVVDLIDQDRLVQADLDVIWKGATFILAEWDDAQQRVARGFGIPYHVILAWIAPEQEIYLYEFHEGEDPPREWDGRILYRQGNLAVVPIDGYTADTFNAAGFHAIRVDRVPRGWAKTVQSLVPFSCGFNPTVGDLLGRTNQSQWLDWIEKLSGEEPIVVGGTTYVSDTRYSNSLGSSAANAKAYDFAVQQAQAWHYPAGSIEQDPFSASGVTSKNLILTIPGQTNPGEIVVMSAHLDSISGTATNTTDAPGANDNGTGSATILEAMRLFRQFRFERTVKLIFFTGEEQGLIGSGQYVADHSMTGYVGVVNLDMFGYDGNNDSCFEIHIGTLPQSLDVGNCFDASRSAYSLGLERDFLTSGATDRSDHAKFWQVNVGAIEIAENFFTNNQAGGCPAADANPGYHTVGDSIPGANLMPSFAFRIGKAGLATVAAMAVPIGSCFGSAPALTGTPVMNGVDLSWSPVGGASTYRLYRSTQGCTGQWFEIASTSGTSATDTAVSLGSQYAYYVEAAGADGFCASAMSNCVVTGPAYYHAIHSSSAIQDQCLSGGPGNGNGVLEPGETALIPVTLLNDGTAILEGISGTLSVSTPGVTVTDPLTTWPDIPAGQSAASNADHFAVSASLAAACGTPVANTLSLSYANGGNSTSLGNLSIGATADATALSESFSGGIPASWTIVDGGSGGTATTATWTTANPRGRAIAAPFSSPWAMVDSDAAGNAAVQDEQLISPTLDLSACGQAVLEFSNQFRRYSGALNEQADVDVSTNGGSSWTNVLKMQGTTGDNGYPTPNTKSIDITSAIAGNPANVRLRWHYYNGQYEYWWAIDNVKVRCLYSVCNVCAAGAAPPGEAAKASPLTLQKAGGDLILSWGAPGGGCGPAAYAVYRGDLHTLRTTGYSHDTSLTCSEGTLGHTLPIDDPRLGAADYFLVVSSNGTSEGSYGRGSNGLERPASAAACEPSQNLNVCGP